MYSERSNTSTYPMPWLCAALGHLGLNPIHRVLHCH
jgi:hypothetical protein